MKIKHTCAPDPCVSSLNLPSVVLNMLESSRHWKAGDNVINDTKRHSSFHLRTCFNIDNSYILPLLKYDGPSKHYMERALRH
jgi:hypothetical protein